MQPLAGTLLMFIAALTSSTASAYPDGSPWGAANPSAEQHCASCHFDYDPVTESDAIRIDGLPKKVAANQEYELIVRFLADATVISGFQMTAHTENEDAGTFSSPDPDVEYIGAAIRSTAWREYDGGVAWPVKWHTPSAVGPQIAIYVAASSSNYDGSPFGDTIHFKSYVLGPTSQTGTERRDE